MTITTIDVAVIGAGFAGLAMAVRLRGAGLDDVVLLERGGALGGTWRDNTYPGAACDIPSHLYSLSFHPKHDWSRTYARQPEIQAYLKEVADAHDLRRLVRLQAEVTSAAFDQQRGRWTVTLTDGGVIDCRVLVSAVGALKDPAYPAIPGRGAFRGATMHSARWDHDVPLEGRRVGVIGTGASAIQLVPEIAQTAGSVTVFQRTPPWVTPRLDRPYTALEKALMRRLPRVQQAYRRFHYWAKELRHPLVFSRESALSRAAQRQAARWIRHQVDDPALAEKVVPRYRLGCKRILVSSDWYAALRRPDVDVETTAITGITPSGVRLADGRDVALDVLVYATGFTVDRPLGEMRVTGREGRDLAETWGGSPRAHRGVTVPGFPNLFLLLGPNTGLGHNSVVLMIEAQTEYVVQALTRLGARPGADWLDVRPDASDAFVQRIDAEHARAVWTSGCDSWYLGEDGRNFSLWPGTVRAYERELATFDAGSYRLGRVGVDAGDVEPVAV